LALSVPLSRFTSRVGGGSAFYVRHRGHVIDFTMIDSDAAFRTLRPDLAHVPEFGFAVRAGLHCLFAGRPELAHIVKQLFGFGFHFS